MMRIPQTDFWYRFKPADWQFIMDALAVTDRGRQGLAALTEDPDSVRLMLDHPKLFEAMVMSHQAAVLSPALFFFVIIRHTLKQAGVDEFRLAEYIAVVCTDFGLPGSSGAQALEKKIGGLYSFDYLEALNKARGHERFFIHVQCANQFLVLTCLYPSFLHRRAERRGAPDVEYYEQVVITHLEAAANHVLAEEFALDDVLQDLAEAFPPVRRAMNYTLREYLCLGN